MNIKQYIFPFFLFPINIKHSEKQHTERKRKKFFFRKKREIIRNIDLSLCAIKYNYFLCPLRAAAQHSTLYSVCVLHENIKML